MKSSSLLAVVLLFCALAAAQGHRTYPTPPQPMGTAAMAQPGVTHVGHLNAHQLQRDARELSDLAQSVPSDIDSVNRGLLPKNLMDKLKRIEKLSKQLRGEIAR